MRRLAAQRPVARVAAVNRARERAAAPRRRRRPWTATTSSSSQASSPSTSTTSSRSTSPPPPPSLSTFESFRGRSPPSSSSNDRARGKIIWVEPWTADAAQAASESGIRTLLFDESDAARAADFGTLARFDTVVRFGDGLLCDATGKSVGVAVELRTPGDVRRAEAMASGPLPLLDDEREKEDDGSEEEEEEVVGNANRVVLADARDWSIIPAENLVATFQEARRRLSASHEAAIREWESSDKKQKRPRAPRPTPLLLVTASTADGALALLGALESGVDGVVLRTGDAAQVRALAASVEEATAEAASVVGSPSSSTSTNDDNNIEFEVGVVTSISPAGMGDRVCVDTTVLLEPGEGLLVGSFAAAALLVHSERDGQKSSSRSSSLSDDDGNNDKDDAYISPRPFRVNAGAVHSYVAVPRGRMAYLSELEAGSEVLVVRPPMMMNSSSTIATTTTTRTAVVGRAKVERRPMVRVDVSLADGTHCSAVLQNAETVRVVAPAVAFASSSSSAPPLQTTRPRSLPRRRRLGAEDEEALRWAMQPPSPSSASPSSSSSPPPSSSSSSASSPHTSFPLRKLDAGAEKTLEWVMGPQAPNNDNKTPSSSPFFAASSSSSSSSDESDAEELVEGPPARPHLPPRKHDSRAAAALRWLLNGGKASSSSASDPSAPSSPAASSAAPPAFPSPKWNPNDTQGWKTVSVTDLVKGQPLLVRRAAAARHTGIEIEEFVVER